MPHDLMRIFNSKIKGGFGIGLGVGAGVATPVGNFAFGDGQSKYH